ncbi:MAG: metallophosphoesterase [Polyangiaceae bacterium]
MARRRLLTALLPVALVAAGALLAACPSEGPVTSTAGGTTSAGKTTSSTGASTGSMGSGAAGGTTSASSGSGMPAAEVRVAFIGDTGNGSTFGKVLDLVKAEKVDGVIHNGDFDYGLDPDGFFATVDGKLGASFPYFASVGNHDAPAWDAYAPYVTAHAAAAGVALDDPNILDEKFAFTWKGIHFVFVGQNGKNDEFAQFIEDQFQGPTEAAWRVCGWHKNQKAMQIGGKGDEMGWGVYETCRAKGAMVTTGHEHSYERTKTLVSMTDQTVDPACSDPSIACLAPGKTFAVVSGLGGIGIRDQNRCLPTTPPYGCKGEWASIYASDQGANYGALFVVFNEGGDPSKAHAYFKNIDGAIIDQFEIKR